MEIVFPHVFCTLLFLFWAGATQNWAVEPTSTSLVESLESVSRQGMVEALLGDRESLAKTTTEARKIELQLKKKEEAPQISDKLMALRAWSAPTSPERNALLKVLVASKPGPLVLRQARHARQQNPISQIHRLRRENHYNEFTGVFNYLARLGSNLITFNTESLSHVAIDFFFLWEPFVTLSSEDREAIVVYDQNRPEIQAANADTPEIEAMVERLRSQLIRRNVGEEIFCGNWYMRRELWQEAEMAFRRAQAIDPANSEAKEGQVAALKQLSALYRARSQSLEVRAAKVHPPLSESDAASTLTLALCATTPGQARKVADEFWRKFPTSSLAPDAAYAATALEHSTGAISSLEPSSGSAEDFLESSRAKTTNAAAHWREYHDSADANPAAALQKETSQRRADAWAYLLTGRNEPQDFPTIENGSTQKIHQILNSFGILLPLDWLRRGGQMAIANPLDDSEWRNAAVRFIDSSTTGSYQTPKVAAELARSYERKQLFNQARAYHTLAFGEDAAYTAKLDEKAAQQLRALAESQTDQAQRHALLDATSRRFPNTKAGRKAKTRLAELDRKGFDLVQIKKYELSSWPDFWLNKGLPLDLRWFDGNLRNGEISDDGVHFRAPEGETIEFTIRYPWGNEKKKLTPNEDQLRQIRAALQFWQKESEARRRAQALLDRPPLLMEVEGSAGPTGVDVFPQLMPFSADQETLPLFRSPLQTQ